MKENGVKADVERGRRSMDDVSESGGWETWIFGKKSVMTNRYKPWKFRQVSTPPAHCYQQYWWYYIDIVYIQYTLIVLRYVYYLIMEDKKRYVMTSLLNISTKHTCYMYLVLTGNLFALFCDSKDALVEMNRQIRVGAVDLGGSIEAEGAGEAVSCELWCGHGTSMKTQQKSDEQGAFDDGVCMFLPFFEGRLNCWSLKNFGRIQWLMGSQWVWKLLFPNLDSHSVFCGSPVRASTYCFMANLPFSFSAKNSCLDDQEGQMCKYSVKSQISQMISDA